MNKHHQERAFLLWTAKTAPKTKERSSAPGIKPSDYTAIYTPPTNNSAPLYGPCLIWRRGLDAKGYGIIQWKGKTTRAHRVAYEVSRGSIPNNKIITHLCNRRSCIQPAHLHAGTPQDNADDKKAKTQNWFFTEAMFEKHNKHVQESIQHIWTEPPITELALPTPPPEHICNFVVAAGETKLCDVCYQPPTESDLYRFVEITDFQEHETQNRQQYLDMNRKTSPLPFDSRPVP